MTIRISDSLRAELDAAAAQRGWTRNDFVLKAVSRALAGEALRQGASA